MRRRLVLAFLAAALLVPAAGLPGADAGLDGAAVPVLLERGEAGPFTVLLPLAPGEARGDQDLSVTGDGVPAPAAVRVVERHGDGSAAVVEIRWRNVPAGRRLVEVRPARLADPTRLEPAQGSPRADGTGYGRPRLTTAALAPRVEELYRASAEAGETRPDWWGSVTARLSRDLAPDDHAGQLDFVEVVYAEKGRPREAIRLFSQVEEAARRDDPRTSLTACYEIAHLYEGALRDFPRALATYLRCDRFPLSDPAEARQNRIAAGFGAARAVEGLGDRRGALALYRLLARDLLLVPDPYGDLVLPEVFLRIGDVAAAMGDEEAVASAYRATMAAAERLPAGAPSSFRAPGSSARAALRLLSARGLAFGRVPDGSYEGEAFGYNAPVGVRMTFSGGRCTALHVTDLEDKRPLDAYRLLPERILETQSLAVDAVTGATVTSRAIVSAATEAVYQAGGAGSRGGGTGGD